MGDQDMGRGRERGNHTVQADQLTHGVYNVMNAPNGVSFQLKTCDIEDYDSTWTWAFDKPNLPKTPPGFKKRLVLRKNYSKMDCYYDAPNGKRLRSKAEVSRFLDKHPEYKKDISPSDFSFFSPKIMEDTNP
ncbi:hypothetical protein RD792_018012 [Penstemon davidsonii]|uniref:MBD domain-containing protein n=1 Tax=Penstemon davidsonii TaxID=160366 RepID=A0ABR0DV75_9LAMI|nr:hypothetical protein RD792_018012 [Penstemon davidsonii]